MSTTRRSARRRMLRTWLPTGILALICAAVVVGAFAVQNSWWADPEPSPAADQVASDGMSTFDGAGVDFLTRDGVARIRMQPEALPATAIGLEATGTRTVDPIVPVRVVILAPDGPLTLELVEEFDITTAGDSIRDVTLVPVTDGSWSGLRPELERWGWTGDQLRDFDAALTAAAREGSDESYSAELPGIEVKGLRVGGRVDVDGGVGLSITVSAPPA